MWVTLSKEHLSHPAGERLQVSKKDGAALIEAGTATKTKASKDPGKSVAKKVLKSIEGQLAEQIATQTEAAITKAFDGAGISRPDVRVVLDEKDKTKTFGDFCLTVARNDWRRAEKVYASQLMAEDGNPLPLNVKASLAESAGVTGGYTVPLEFMPRLMAAIVENALIRPRAQIFPMATRNTVIPVLDQSTSQGAGNSSFLAGIKAFWTEEAASLTEIDPIFKQMELVARELTGYTVASNTLLADNAVGLEGLLMSLFGKGISWYEDYAFLQGDGVAKPTGILNSPATLTVTRATANTVKYVDLVTMVQKMLPQSMSQNSASTQTGKAIWFASIATYSQLTQMTDGSSRILWQPIANPTAGAAAMAAPSYLLGMPIIFTEKLPTLGTKGDVLLCDPSLYLIGDRPQVEIAYSPHVKFLNNQAAWRFVHRVDGRPWLSGPITLADGTNQVSPFVALV